MATTAYDVNKYGNNGVGYDPNKFNSDMSKLANDPAALQAEIGRVNGIIGNRNAAGMDIANQTDYLGKLQALQKSPTAPIDMNQYKTQMGTIQDLKNKYGFDYTPEYANQQAEVLRQEKQAALEAQRRDNTSAHNQTNQLINDNFNNSARSLDTNNFLAMLNTAQNQTNNGQNAGIASDQNTRLGMAFGNNLANILTQKNQASQAEQNRFTNSDLNLLAQISMLPAEQQAQAAQIYQSRLENAFQHLLDLRSSDQRDAATMLQGALQQRGQNIGVDQFNQQFNYKQQQDSKLFTEQQRQFNAKLEQDAQQFAQDMGYKYDALSQQKQLALKQLAASKGANGYDPVAAVEALKTISPGASDEQILQTLMKNGASPADILNAKAYLTQRNSALDSYYNYNAPSASETTTYPSQFNPNYSSGGSSAYPNYGNTDLASQYLGM